LDLIMQNMWHYIRSLMFVIIFLLFQNTKVKKVAIENNMSQSADPPHVLQTSLQEGPTYPWEQNGDFKKGIILMGVRDFCFHIYNATVCLLSCLRVCPIYIVRGGGIEGFTSFETHDDYKCVGFFL
jgi:hypothetical protein